MAGTEMAEHKFKTLKEAEKMAARMKKQFGYKPEVFKIKTQKGAVHYSVIKPKGLVRVDKK